ncbi:protein MMS22-like isoform X2 [Pocillopora verrucosa]|uniref:protein MMS22-like isoform X2 n=1 Tax=Pocillopora verrucosa TaxID=203993 RepID=UPI00333F5389
MMEFDFSVADLQDLSEWPDSLEFDEFFDPSEVHEEPSAKRRRTSTDKSPKTHAVASVSRKPAELNCNGHISSNRIKEALCQNGYLTTGVFSAVLHHEDPYPGLFSNQIVKLFGATFVSGSVLLHQMETLFFMLRQQVFRLENDGSITTLSDDVHSRCVELRRLCSEFCAFLLHFTHKHLHATQDSVPGNPLLREWFLLPSKLTKQLEDLSLFLGRFSSLPSSFTMINPVNSIGPVRLKAGGHLFHLHLELNWAAIQTLCLILTEQGQSDSFSSDQFVDVINSLKRYTFSFLWDLIALAVSIYNKENQSNVLQVCPFPCGCVGELWIMLIHLMDHLSTKTDLESFWSAVSSIMSEILYPKESEPDSQDSTVQPWAQSCAPPDFTVKTPVNFCWWLLTHLSPLYWFTDKGVYFQRKKSCVPGNWVLAQDLLKASLLNNKESHEESRCRYSLRCCISLSYHWSANSDLILWLWDFFHKRLNNSFHVPEQSMHGFGLVSLSSLQWTEQCLNRSKASHQGVVPEHESSFTLFLRLVSVHLTKLLKSGSLQAWKQMKGRFYSKFHKRRMEELNITGLHHFITLFLTLSCVADLEDVAHKMCSFLDLLDFHKMAQEKKISVWKGLFALMLIYKEKNVDFGYLAERLSYSFVTVAREYTNSSRDKTHQKNCWQLITLYLDSTQDVFEHKNKQDLSESKLIADGFQYLLHSCRDNELRYLLSFVQTILASLTQKYGGRPGFSDAVSVMWKHVFSHVRTLTSDGLCIQSVPSPLADTLAGFTLSALDRYPEEVTGTTGVTFTSLLRDLGIKDEMSASFCCRFLCHILPCPSATTAIQAENMERDIIHAWFRCLLQLPPSHEGLTELTRVVGKLPELEKLLRGQPGFGTGESSETSLQLFIVALGRHHASLTKFDDSIQFRETVQRYLGDVIKYVDHVLKDVGPANLLRIAYHVAGLLTKHCYKIIYSRTQPRCLFPRLVDQFVLPLPNSKKPVAPLVMQCIKAHLHQFLQGLACLDFKRDEFIRRKIKQIFISYFRLFNQILPSSSQAANIPTKNPFLVVLKGSCLTDPAPENSEFRQFVVEIIQENFLCLPQQPANLATTLSFLEQLFRKTLCSSETARNTPVLLESIMFCLLTCNQFTAGNEPPEIRRQATEILRLMVGACTKTPEMNSREVLLPHLRNFLYSKITLYQGLVFKTLETLVPFDSDLVTALIPACKQAVIQLEQKRGVGTDMQLRSSFKSFLSKLGHSGGEAIKDFEKEDTATTLNVS